MMGRLEWKLMEILWSTREATVNDVVSRLDRPLAYTTIMTTLDRLYKKGLLERKKLERAFLYAPKFTRTEFERKRAGEFLTEFLSGPKPSGDVLISCLVDVVGEQDAALLDELERKIRSKRRELDRGRRTA
jgi:predicted transcriptional regulator